MITIQGGSEERALLREVLREAMYREERQILGDVDRGYVQCAQQGRRRLQVISDAFKATGQ